MSWCYCCEDEFINPWKDNTKYVIKILEKLQRLGRNCIRNKQLDRESHPNDVRQIEDYFRKLDVGIHSLKLKAVEFLIPNVTLLKRRNCEINHYKINFQHKLDFLHGKTEVLKEKYSKDNIVREDEPCSSKLDCNKFLAYNKISEDVPEEQIIATEVFNKQDNLLNDLKKLLLIFDDNIKSLEDQIICLKTKMENKREDSTDNEQNNSEYDSTSQIQLNNDTGTAQYSATSVEYQEEYQNNKTYSSNESLTALKREILQQGWPIFRDCIGCLWGNYCTSAEQHEYIESYSSTRNWTESTQEAEEGDNRKRQRSKNRNAKRSRDKSKGKAKSNKEVSSNDLERKHEKKKEQKRDKSRDKLKKKQPKQEKVKKEKKIKQKNKSKE